VTLPETHRGRVHDQRRRRSASGQAADGPRGHSHDLRHPTGIYSPTAKRTSSPRSTPGSGGPASNMLTLCRPWLAAKWWTSMRKGSLTREQSEWTRGELNP
jgi:hypothetical protein